MENNNHSVDLWFRRITVYGAIGVTVSVFVLFLYGMIVASGFSEPSAFNALLETIKNLVMVASGYWLGSSFNSSKKDDMLARNSEMLAKSVPADMVRNDMKKSNCSQPPHITDDIFHKGDE
jgi:hypothetical protein